MACKLHPLDPLTANEITKTSKLIRKIYPNQKWIFNSILLQEPKKEHLLQNPTELEVERKAFAIIIEIGTGKVCEVLVNLEIDEIEKFINVPIGNQPTLTPEDCFEAERITKNDARVQNRCAQLGFHNMNLVSGDAWSVGYLDDRPEFLGMRLVQLFIYGRIHENENHYAHPFNFVVLTDLTTGKVVSIEDLPIGTDTLTHPVKIPRKFGNYLHEFLDNEFFRTDLKPLEISSPEGPSFTVNGNFIEWQKFSFRISFNYREGLVLHNVNYKDGDNIRTILHRVSLCEMAVPYGDPRPPFHRKCAFDVADYGLGFCTNSLEVGCDCVGTIKYFDAILNNHDGQPYTIKNAVCLHEEDAGILFKHTEYRNGKVRVTRSRCLILSFIVTVVNYEYCLYWSFYQDGSIQFNIKATGELSTNLIANNACAISTTATKHGVIVSPNVLAQYHQHLFVVRLDPMIDGINNTISTLDVQPLVASEENPYQQGFTLLETPLKTTSQGKTKSCPELFRTWKISNISSLNSITGEPVAWKLIPNNPCTLLANPESYIYKKAEFAENTVWITPYDDTNFFPSGFYVLNKGLATNGINEWTREEKNIEDTDVVLWHVFGMTHCPRVEDYPIMSVETAGFTLKPYNFFDQNPGLDVPSQNRNTKSKCVEKEQFRRQ